jgi:hypothetical protein
MRATDAPADSTRLNPRTNLLCVNDLEYASFLEYSVFSFSPSGVNRIMFLSTIRTRLTEVSA